jgi:hypothetical protein
MSEIKNVSGTAFVVAELSRGNRAHTPIETGCRHVLVRTATQPNGSRPAFRQSRTW